MKIRKYFDWIRTDLTFNILWYHNAFDNKYLPGMELAKPNYTKIVQTRTNKKYLTYNGIRRNKILINTVTIEYECSHSNNEIEWLLVY